MEAPAELVIDEARRTIRPRILLVDDEPDVLAALFDVLRRRYTVVGATSGAQALNLLVESEPFAVVMSDFQMPAMDGAEFLAQACIAAPNTVRLLLTGHATMDAAMAAVNDGHIYRFLKKPCPPDQLIRALEDAVDQYRMITADATLFERKLESLSEHLLRAERLASFGAMAAAMGHELKSVAMTLSDGLAQLEASTRAGQPVAAATMDSLHHASDCLAIHASSLLHLSRPARPDEPLLTELRAAGREIVETLRKAGILRGVRVQLIVGPLRVVARLPRTEFEQVLINLVKNAVDALADARGQHPLIEVSVDLDSSGRARCVVEDNAHGIPEAQLPLIFEPYYTTKAADRGTGLGLFAVRHIVRSSGGEVTVKSAVGHGTAVTVTLPVATA